MIEREREEGGERGGDKWNTTVESLDGLAPRTVLIDQFKLQLNPTFDCDAMKTIRPNQNRKSMSFGNAKVNCERQID
jgi:hypothetical protein